MNVANGCCVFAARLECGCIEAVCWCRRVKGLLGPLTLRRLKTQVRNGQPLVALPKRDVFVEHVELSEEERSLYDAMQTQGKLIVSKLVTLAHCMPLYSFI